MKSLLKIIVPVIILIGFLVSCEKAGNEFPEDLNFNIKPLEPLTTDIVKFEIANGEEDPKDGKLFFRWDWDGDSIWDTDFSSLAIISKRFYYPGEHKVLLQYSDGEGKSKLVTQIIKVDQGYSAPKPFFTISPGTGNYTQEFVFDARQSYDDEDSISLLLFRWDFQGDGNWDTGFDTSKIVSQIFHGAGVFNPILEVKDPLNLVGSTTKNLIVHKTDTLIKVNIELHPKDIAVGDTVVIDASDSYHSLYSDLDFQTSWKLPNNPEWTAPSYAKRLTYVFKSEGVNEVKCKVIIDKWFLENTVSIEIFVAEENLPPKPSFELSIPYGNINTQFYFDCWGSRDDHIPPSQIELRWDWNSDGFWDTSFSKDKEYFHQYNYPGKYRITLEAKDDQDARAKVYGEITVSPYENPTGYIKDIRDGELYGTVQIGNQWWMAENLRFEVPGKTESGMYTTICLLESEEWCESVGKLYHVSSITKDRFDNKEVVVCPKGWRIPTKVDFEELITTIGGVGYGKDLTQGGSTDFNGTYTGYASFQVIFNPADTTYTFHYLFESMVYPSSSIADDINEVRTDIFMIDQSRNSNSLWTGYLPTRYYVPVRCIKED